MIHGIFCHMKTFPLNCRYCQQRIFFFSCDCGSRVLFDELGPPWPMHDCRTQNQSTTPYKPSNVGAPIGVSVYRRSHNPTGLMYGWRNGKDSIDPALARRANESQNLTRNTVAIEPIGSIDAEFIGVVRERLNPDLAQRQGLGRNSIGFRDLVRAIGDADPVQLTVQVDELPNDPAAIDYSGYTFLLPRKLAPRDIERGALILARLSPVEALGGISRVWLAREIELLTP